MHEKITRRPEIAVATVHPLTSPHREWGVRSRRLGWFKKTFKKTGNGIVDAVDDVTGVVDDVTDVATDVTDVAQKHSKLWIQ